MDRDFNFFFFFFSKVGLGYDLEHINFLSNVWCYFCGKKVI